MVEDIFVVVTGLVSLGLIALVGLAFCYGVMRLFSSPKDNAYIREHIVDPETLHLLDVQGEE